MSNIGNRTHEDGPRGKKQRWTDGPSTGKCQVSTSFQLMGSGSSQECGEWVFYASPSASACVCMSVCVECRVEMLAISRKRWDTRESRSKYRRACAGSKSQVHSSASLSLSRALVDKIKIKKHHLFSHKYNWAGWMLFETLGGPI